MGCSCLGCCKINKENRGTLPFFCKKIQMPCMAIEPQYIETQSGKEKLMEFAFSVNRIREVLTYEAVQNMRIPMDSEYIDKQFVERHIESFDKLVENGGITIFDLESM